jgi:DNA-directed RNA polymerases I, II, and III subunit RPABC2
MSYFDDNVMPDSESDDDKKTLVDDDDDEDEDEDELLVDDDDEDEHEVDDDVLVGDDDEFKAPHSLKADKKIKDLPLQSYNYTGGDNDSDSYDDDDENDESYLQKFDKDINDNYLLNYHPECVHQNYDEVLALCNVIRNKDNIIIDDLHRTIPYLTKYEKARILGQRAKQINSGSPPFIKVPENVIDGYLIAQLELKAKRIPFIIRRPLPNGGSEYWKVNDLEDIIY